MSIHSLDIQSLKNTYISISFIMNEISISIPQNRDIDYTEFFNLLNFYNIKYSKSKKTIISNFSDIIKEKYNVDIMVANVLIDVNKHCYLNYTYDKKIDFRKRNSLLGKLNKNLKYKNICVIKMNNKLPEFNLFYIEENYYFFTKDIFIYFIEKLYKEYEEGMV